MEIFKNDDAGYLQWHSDHEVGFIFNRFGGTNPNMNVLHRGSCSFLWRDKDENGRTTVKKWCSTSEEELVQHANTTLGEGMWKRCGVCFRTPRCSQTQTSDSSTTESAPTGPTGSVWIPGEPAAWIGAGEKEWKGKVTETLRLEAPAETPQWLEIELRLLNERVYRKDIDNMLTPLLESARDAGWVERGFQNLGSVTARKTMVNAEADVGALIIPHKAPPQLTQERLGILIESKLDGFDENSIKRNLYESAFGLYSRRPELRFPPLSPLSMEIRVDISDDSRRKSIQALIKPCIDGVEPILGHPDNRLPIPWEQLDRRLAPQDEMVLSLAFHVRGGASNGISVMISPFEDLPSTNDAILSD